MTGYSGTPLAKKLGIKDGYIIRLINEPGYYFDLFPDLQGTIRFSSDVNEKKHLIHFFAKDANQLSYVLPGLKDEIVPMVLSGYRGQRNLQKLLPMLRSTSYAAWRLITSW